jgi:ligand-binding sensor domain-containing protein
MKNRYSSEIFFIFLLLTSILSVNAQPKNVRFQHLTINDGLSDIWVHSIIQDKYGFIWMGTDDGLNRYDGYAFRVFKNNHRDSNSISSSNVMAMFEDSRGYFWIGTRQGLNLYDRKNECFIHDPRFSGEEILSIVEDRDGNLWIGATRTFFRLNLKNDSLISYSPDYASNNRIVASIGGHRVILVDSKNRVWIATGYGLLLYDKERDYFKNYVHDDNDPQSIITNDVYSILEDKAGNLWIGTSAGLELFKNANEYPEKGIFMHHQNNISDQKSISKGTILSLLEDSRNNLWIGIENGGLDLLDSNAYKDREMNFVHFRNEPSRQTSLSSNSIHALLEDIQGNIWIGTFGDGVNIINPVSDKFTHVMNIPGEANSLFNNHVHAFEEDNNFLWIGTSYGLSRYNKKEGSFKHYVNDPLNRRSIASNAIWTLCKDKSGNLWIGTWGGGLNRFDYQTETFERYSNDPLDTNSIGSNNMFSIFEDRDRNLWIGTMGGGLNMFDFRNKSFIRYTQSNSGIYTNYIQAITEDENGDLWFANGSAFCRFDKRTKEFETFLHSENDSTSLSSNKVISIFKDSKGNLWMGTDAGLNLFNKAARRFTCYRVENGFPNNTINSILEDNGGNLWIGTNRGLSKFVNAVNLPAKPVFKNYTHGDGLQGDGFNRRSCYKGADGLIYLGGTNGFNIFDPDKITDNKYVPPIVISDFQIFNKSEPIGDKGLKKDSSMADDLVISYKQSVFSFDFAALNYISPMKNQYAYKMEGFDYDWNYIGTKRTVTYTNLDPGRYIFKVKGSNNDGVWNEEGISIAVVITPPFWETKWFFGIMLITIGGIIFGLYRWRVWQLLKREKELNNKIQEALAKNKILSGLLPICANCKKIRDDKGYWDQLEGYIQTHSEAQFTHGICPDCVKKLYPGVNIDDL